MSAEKLSRGLGVEFVRIDNTKRANDTSVTLHLHHGIVSPPKYLG